MQVNYSFLVLSSLFLTVLGAPTSQNVTIRKRIIGGTNAPDGQYPFIVSIRYNSGKNQQCGGSILSDTYIVTAAHCFDDTSDFYIVYGTNQPSSAGTRTTIANFYIHPDYNKDKIINDIAIIEVKDKIQLSDSAQAIPMASSVPDDGSECVLPGWGTTSWPKTNFPNDLLQMTTYIVPLSDCKEQLKNARPSVTDNNVCAYSGKKGVGFCHGDSGGPLVCNNEQVGIVSWMIECGTGVPDVYTSVPAFRSWIQETTGI